MNRLNDFKINHYKCLPYWDLVHVTTTLVQCQGCNYIVITIVCVRSITFEPFEEFWNNSPQILTIMRQCAEQMMQVYI